MVKRNLAEFALNLHAVFYPVNWGDNKFSVSINFAKATDIKKKNVSQRILIELLFLHRSFLKKSAVFRYNPLLTN